MLFRSALHEDELAEGIQVFHVRDGRIRGERGFVTDKIDDADASGIMQRVLQQLYAADGGEVPPREVLLNVEPVDPLVVGQWLDQRRGSTVDVRVPQRGDKRALMEIVERNAAQALALYRSKRGADIASRSRALEEIAEYLDLRAAPLRIECIDVSHLDGTNVVASLVVFEDGLPTRKEYRRFVLKHGQGNNDVLSISEVVSRRFRDTQTANDDVMKRKFSYPPQLLIVDGGKPQVNAAYESLQLAGVEIPVVGIAKRMEELWLPDASDPIIMPRNSEGLFMLQRVRDEAHRFAISHQRQRARKSLLDSLLDDVPGLGEVRKRALVKHFGSVKRLRSASMEEIAATPGIGSQLASTLHTHLAAIETGTALNTATGEIVDGA